MQCMQYNVCNASYAMIVRPCNFCNAMYAMRCMHCKFVLPCRTADLNKSKHTNRNNKNKHAQNIKHILQTRFDEMIDDASDELLAEAIVRHEFMTSN